MESMACLFLSGVSEVNGAAKKYEGARAKYSTSTQPFLYTEIGIQFHSINLY
jgi:hypothetical protein